MRVLAACLTAVLGLSGLVTMGACSSSTDASGGAGGGATTAGAGGGSAAGSSSTAGAGGATCLFKSDACQGCINTNCGMLLGACAANSTCAAQIKPLQMCACDGTSTTDQCALAFQTAGGKPAEDLITCYSLKCTDSCQPPAQ